jgi:hypothetical protein
VNRRNRRRRILKQELIRLRGRPLGVLRRGRHSRLLRGSSRCSSRNRRGRSREQHRFQRMLDIKRERRTDLKKRFIITLMNAFMLRTVLVHMKMSGLSLQIYMKMRLVYSIHT